MTTDPFKELLHGLDAQLSGKNLQEKRERVVEEEFVKFLLKKLNLEAHKRELADYSQTHFATRYMRLIGFMERFPSFPVQLEFRYVKGLAKRVNRQSLFMNFVNLPFMAAYSDVLEAVGPIADSKAVGLVMPWGALPGGMVLHNCELDPDNDGTRLVWIHRNKKAKVRQRLVLEPMSSLLRSVSRWTPDD